MKPSCVVPMKNKYYTNGVPFRLEKAVELNMKCANGTFVGMNFCPNSKTIF